MKPGPGTWGSAAALLIWRFVGPRVPLSHRSWVCAGAAVVVTLIGIPAATRVARSLGKEDPSQVVVDEVAGQLVTFIAAPVSWASLLTGFLLFRAFDILKPPPVRQLEALPEGIGIMMDDVGAGIYALVVLQVLLHFGFLR